MRRLDLVIGPNGAGKSTFVAEILSDELPTMPFVNADQIAHKRWPGEEAGRSYEAARIAARTREQLIELGTSFIAETVASHPSKLELISSARERGYFVIVHVILVPEELAVSRVAHRVAAGGHAVPVQKIRERYQRIWPIAAAAIRMADHAAVYDNSALSGYRIVAEFNEGEMVGLATWPTWTPASLVN